MFPNYKQFLFVWMLVAALLVAAMPKPAFGYWQCEFGDTQCIIDRDAFAAQQRNRQAEQNPQPYQQPQQPFTLDTERYYEDKELERRLERIERKLR